MCSGRFRYLRPEKDQKYPESQKILETLKNIQRSNRKQIITRVTIGTYDLTSNAVANVNTEAWNYTYMISSLLVTEVIKKHSDHVSAINPHGHQNLCHLHLQPISVLRNLLYLLHTTTNSRLLVLRLGAIIMSSIGLLWSRTIVVSA